MRRDLGYDHPNMNYLSKASESQNNSVKKIQGVKSFNKTVTTDFKF